MRDWILRDACCGLYDMLVMRFSAPRGSGEPCRAPEATMQDRSVIIRLRTPAVTNHQAGMLDILQPEGTVGMSIPDTCTLLFQDTQDRRPKKLVASPSAWARRTLFGSYKTPDVEANSAQRSFRSKVPQCGYRKRAPACLRLQEGIGESGEPVGRGPTYRRRRQLIHRLRYELGEFERTSGDLGGIYFVDCGGREFLL